MSQVTNHSLEAALIRAWPPGDWLDAHVMLAVSGGPDSVALLRAMQVVKERGGGAGRLFAAHLNHGLRAVAADEDAAWLEELCDRWKIPLKVGRIEVSALATLQGDGWEAAARSARYDFLRAAAEKQGARFLAVAHQADDQTETVLHRILRGTGLAGLSGMPRVRPLSPSVTLVRPLLDVRRSEVLSYLQALGQDYRTDESNSDRRWTRNRLRSELLPALRQEYNATIDDALRRLAEQAGEAQSLISELATGLAAQSIELVEPSPAMELRINCTPLAGQSRLVIREVCKIAWSQARLSLQSMGFDQWQQLAELISGPPIAAPANLPGNIRAARDGNRLVLATLQSSYGPAG